MATVDSSLTQIEIPVTELQLGMYVSELDIPWLESPFLFQGFAIESREQLEEVRSVCKRVKIDTRQSTVVHEEPAAAGPTVYDVPVERELAAASGLRRDSRDLVRRMFASIQAGKGIDASAVNGTVVETVDSVLRNPDALLLLTQIKNKDDYTAEHCMNVSVLTAAFARHLGLERSRIEEAAYCALLHDIGKIRVPDAVLNKPGRFNRDELALMRNHTVFGREVLLTSHGVIPAAIDVAHGHHERVDGGGYPRSIPAEDVPWYARLVSVTDAYDAITSARCYDGARSTFDALQTIYKARGTQFDAALVERFIEFMGVYPPGTVVEMHNGEIGVVLSVPPAHKLEPRIMLVRDSALDPIAGRIVDLRRGDLDVNKQRYRIEKTHPQGSFGIEARDYLAKGLGLPGLTGANDAAG